MILFALFKNVIIIIPQSHRQTNSKLIDSFQFEGFKTNHSVLCRSGIGFAAVNVR